MCILNTNACMIRMSVIFFSRHAFCNTFSTHDLSWRSTKSSNISPSPHVFSTHDLSGRSTIGDVSSIHIALFSTHDLSGRSTFGLRLCVRGTLFSTHDLSGRSTISRYIRRTHWFFQLTTSRGGRRLDLKLIYRFYLFNSRPLGEVDKD